MKHKQTILLLLISLGFHLTAKGQETLSFRDAQDLLLGQNKTVKISEKHIQISQAEEKIAHSMRLPHFQLFGVTQYVNQDISFDLNEKRNQLGTLLGLADPATLGNWNLTLQKKDMQFAGASMTWPLFTGGKINAANQAAKIKSAMANNDHEETEDGLISELAERYFQAKLAAEAALVYQQVLEGMKAHLLDAQKLEKNGMLSGAEVLQTKVAVADADQELLAAQKDVQLAQTALSNTLETANKTYILSTPFSLAPQSTPLTEFQRLAVSNYSKIKQLKLVEKLAEQKIKAEKADFLPDIAFTGQKIIASNNFPLYDNPLILGVGLKYNLFDGFARKNKIHAARLEQETSTLLRQKAETDIQTLVEKFYNESKKSAEQITSLETSISLAKELVRVRSLSFREGMASSTDVIDAELKLHTVKLKNLQAYADYAITLAQLYELCGMSKQYVNTIQ